MCFMADVRLVYVDGGLGSIDGTSYAGRVLNPILGALPWSFAENIALGNCGVQRVGCIALRGS